MIFKPTKYEEFAKKAVDKLQKSQSSFTVKFGTDNYANWFYNQSSETLKLFNEDNEVYFRYIPVGTFSQNTNTWMWGWANKDSVEPRKLRTLKLKELGEKKNYKNLTNAYFDGDKFTGWELTAIAFDLIGGIGTYRVISDHLEKYLVSCWVSLVALINRVLSILTNAFMFDHFIAPVTKLRSTVTVQTRVSTLPWPASISS